MPSSTLDEAKVRAEEAAKTLIERKFKEAAALEDMYDMRAEYRRKLAATESQLSTVVRARLDGVKRARDLIEDSALQIEDLHTQFSKMEDLSRDCRGLFGKYPHIKTLHYARSNLAVTTQLVEFFFSIPAKCTNLQELLQTRPALIKAIYQESLKLVAWRDSFMEALKSYGDRAQGRATFNTSRGGADPNKYQKIVHKAGPLLADIQALDAQIRKVVVDTVVGADGAGLLGLAVNDPAHLVRTMEVAELIRLRQKRRFEAAKKSALRDISGEGGEEEAAATAAMQGGSEGEFKAVLLEEVRRSLEEKLGHKFANLQMTAVDEGQSRMVATLGAASQLLIDMQTMETYVPPCFPPEYAMKDFLRSIYRAFLESLLLPMTKTQSNVAEFDVKDLMEAIRWFIYFDEHVERNKEFQDVSNALLATYLLRIRSQIVQWGANLKADKAELVQDGSKRYFSTYPDDLFKLMDVQVQVAKSLPGKLLGKIVATCLEGLQKIQDEYVKKVSSEWRMIAAEEDGLEHLCAIVNDNERLQEKSDDFIKDLSANLPEGEKTKAELDEQMETVSSGYIEVALLATGTIAASIVVTLREEHVVSRLFSPEWETGDFEGMKTVVETCNDFFGDLEVWLPDFFFAKLVRASLGRMVKMYVEALLCKAKPAAGAAPTDSEGEPEQVALQPFQNIPLSTARIADDVDLLVLFFTEEAMKESGATLGDLCAQAGLRGPNAIREEASIINSINTVLAADSMDSLPGSVCQAAIKAIVHEFKSQGVEAVMHLLSLQQPWSGDDRAQREQFVERLARTCGDWDSSGETSTRFVLEGYANDGRAQAAKLRGQRTTSRKDRWKVISSKLRQGHISVEDI